MAKSRAYRWQGWAVRERTDTELQSVFSARARQHALEAEARSADTEAQNAETAAWAAPKIAAALPEHTEPLTLDDICAFAGVDRLAASAGCDALVSQELMRRRVVFVDSIGRNVTVVRRTEAGTLENGPLRRWIEDIVDFRYSGDPAAFAQRLDIDEPLVRRRLDAADEDRVLLQAVDLIFVRADATHMLYLLYPLPDERATAKDSDVAGCHQLGRSVDDRPLPCSPPTVTNHAFVLRPSQSGSS